MQRALWLCLRFSQLALEQALLAAGLRLDHPQPAAIASAQQILHCNHAAQSAGIHPGSSLALALSLAPDLQIYPPATAQLQQALQQLAALAYQFTPYIELRAPDCLLLEIASCLRLFGGLDALLQKLQQRLQEQGFQYQLGLARSAEAARLLSQRQPPQPLQASACDDETLQQQLRALPLSQLALSASQQRQLAQLGLQHCGQLLDLPRRELRQRLGTSLSHYLDQLSDNIQAPARHFQPRQRFSASITFSCAQDSHAALRAAMLQLLDQLQRYLRQHQQHCRQLLWHLQQHNGQAQTLCIELSRPQNHPANFLCLSEIQLQQLTLRAPVTGLRLEVEQLLEASADALSLFSPAPGSQHDRPEELLDRLYSRLGRDAVFGLQLCDQQLPELRQRRCAVNPHRAPDLPPAVADADHALPLWLYSKPQRLDRQRQQPFFHSPMELLSAPLRIDSHWWLQRARRDYFIAASRHGERYWIFYDVQQQDWYIHGLFA